MLSSGDKLPDGSTVVRYASYGKMEKEADDVAGETIYGPSFTAFQGTAGEEFLSVTWCEYFLGSPEERLRCAIEAIRASYKVSKTGCFCVGEVDKIIDVGVSFGRATRAIYHPEDNNVAHAGIYEVAPMDTGAFTAQEKSLLQRLAEETWSRFLTKAASDALPLGVCAKSPSVA